MLENFVTLLPDLGDGHDLEVTAGAAWSSTRGSSTSSGEKG